MIFDIFNNIVEYYSYEQVKIYSFFSTVRISNFINKKNNKYKKIKFQT